MQSLKFWILFFIAGVYADTVCETYGIVYTYCKSGSYCCNDNKDCCSSDLGVGAIVGIVIGVVVAITACVIGGCCYCCRRDRSVPAHVIQQNQMMVAAVSQQNTNVAAPQYPAQYPGQYPAQYPYPAYPQGHQPAPTAYPPAYNYGQQTQGYDSPPAIPPKNSAAQMR